MINKISKWKSRKFLGLFLLAMAHIGLFYLAGTGGRQKPPHVSPRFIELRFFTAHRPPDEPRDTRVAVKESPRPVQARQRQLRDRPIPTAPAPSQETASLRSPEAISVPAVHDSADILNSGTSDQGPGRFDMERMRKLARDTDAHTPRPRTSSIKSSEGGDPVFEKAIKSAKRQDCRKLQPTDGSANLLLAVPMLAGALSDTGCKW